jgi:hypothetical protein
MDKVGRDANKNGKADKREGKDVSHNKMLSKGGSNKDGVRIESKSANRIIVAINLLSLFLTLTITV